MIHKVDEDKILRRQALSPPFQPRHLYGEDQAVEALRRWLAKRANQPSELRCLSSEIIAIPPDFGLKFDPGATTARPIRDHELHGGDRVTTHGVLSTAIIQFKPDGVTSSTSQPWRTENSTTASRLSRSDGSPDTGNRRSGQ